jgi:tyrosine-protein kinase Etk/Wzc
MAENHNADEINLLDYLIVILKRKKMIIGVTLSAALITALISIAMPPVYRAETRILPPQQSSMGVASQLLAQFAGDASGLVGGALGIKKPNDVYIGMLKSRTIYDRIIDRFGLMDIYEARYMEDARSRLDEVLNVQSGKDDIITVSVEDKDPERAARMANAFVEEMKDITQNLAVTEASQRRLFFEEQLKRAKENLIKAEEAMKGFQEKTGAIKIEDQTAAVIESIARFRALIAAKEVELKVMKTYATSQNPDFQRVEEELRGMREQLTALEAREGKKPDPLMPTASMPAIGTDYIRKLRDLKYNETLFELMAKQYEIARVDEARDATIIQVLDEAIPPERRAKPKRALMVLVTAFTGLFFSVFGAFFMEHMKNIEMDADNRERLDSIKKYAKLRPVR